LQDNGLLIIRVINADNPMWGCFFYHDFTHQTPFTPGVLLQYLILTVFDLINIDYEVLPRPRKLLGWVKQRVRWMSLWLLGKFLGIESEAFTEDLIAVAKK